MGGRLCKVESAIEKKYNDDRFQCVSGESCFYVPGQPELLLLYLLDGGDPINIDNCLASYTLHAGRGFHVLLAPFNSPPPQALLDP